MSSSRSSEAGNYAFIPQYYDGMERVNAQHQLIQGVCNGHLVHPAIPFSKITSIADIATGTGVWLEQLQGDEIPASASKRCFHGFDISDVQFPKETKCTYIAHDILKPFPPEYHGAYDLVHVRLMYLSLKRGEFDQAMKNIFVIIKPGGYLQWDDIDYEEIRPFPFGPVHAGIIFQTGKLWSGLGMNLSCSDELEAAFKGAGFKWTVREPRNSYWDRDLSYLIQKWAKTLLGSALPRSLNWEGKAKDMDAANRMAKPMLEALDKEYTNGVVPNLPLRVIIAQRYL